MGASADLALPIIFMILLGGVASRDIEVFVNDTVVIRCSPNGPVDIQWHHNSDLNYVYAGGRFFLPYKGRLRLEKDVTTGDYDLIIPNVTLEDAGRYLCQEELSGHRISSTQLTVLYVNPACSSNMPSDGFVGPNTCGLQTENMTFSCDVKFNGRPPYVIWRSANDSQTFCSSSCEVKLNRSICNLTFSADPVYDGSVFICDAITPSGRRFSCNSETIKVWYLLANYENAEKKFQESASCTVRSNLDVQYNWTLKENNERAFLSANQTISFQQSGIHQCEVDYNIRNVACSALVLNVTIQKEQSITTELAIAIALSIGLVVVVALELLFVVCCILVLCDTACWMTLAITLLSIACVVVIAFIGLLAYILNLRSTTTLMTLAITLPIALVVVFVQIALIYRLKLARRRHRRRREYSLKRMIAIEMMSTIDDNREALLEHINASQLIDHLKENCVFDEEQLKSISSKSSPREKNKELLKILMKGDLRSYWLTIGCLHNSNQSRAAEILLENMCVRQSDPAQLPPSTEDPECPPLPDGGSPDTRTGRHNDAAGAEPTSDSPELIGATDSRRPMDRAHYSAIEGQVLLAADS